MIYDYTYKYKILNFNLKLSKNACEWTLCPTEKIGLAPVVIEFFKMFFMCIMSQSFRRIYIVGIVCCVTLYCQYLSHIPAKCNQFSRSLINLKCFIINGWSAAFENVMCSSRGVFDSIHIARIFNSDAVQSNLNSKYSNIP